MAYSRGVISNRPKSIAEIVITGQSEIGFAEITPFRLSATGRLEIATTGQSEIATTVVIFATYSKFILIREPINIYAYNSQILF